MDYEQRKIGIIGAGAAGMMSAIYACQNGADVRFLKKMTVSAENFP